MAIYKDDVIGYFHEKVGDGFNVRHALALTIDHFGERLITWANVVIEREIGREKEFPG